MQRKPASTAAVSHSTIALSLRAPESATRRAMGRLTKAASPPLDHSSLLNAIVGASAIANAAFALLRMPAAEAVHLRDELRLLSEACIEEYECREGCVDALDGLEGRLKANSAWALMSSVGSRMASGQHPAVEAAGIELLLSMHHQKPMAVAFCSGLRIALQNEDLLGMPLQSFLTLQEGDEKPPHWVKHARSTYAEFLSTFDRAPSNPLPPKSFEERARTELSCRAAFASYRRRAGILDDTCLSRRQISEATAYSASGIFQTPEERKAIMWLVGCSGLYATSTQFIPLAGACGDEWVVAYDVATGILRRDFSCLAPDAARARVGNNAPATLVALTPAPIDVAAFFRLSADAKPTAATLGDLIPALRQLTPRDLLYPDLADLAPSLARWSRTLAPLALQSGLDALLAALVTGDFGITARSKVHYCLVDTDEQWQAAADLYKVLGWEPPVAIPDGSLPFGASVVPTAEQLVQADKDAWRWVEKFRPPKRMSNEAQLLEFHNRFTRALAARAATWLSLRPASEISLRASIDERFDDCIELTEKASAGRVGTLPAVACDALRAALVNYRTHCAALLERLRTFGWSGNVIQWLDAVGNRGDVPLFCTIHGAKQLKAVSTDDLQKHVPGIAELAPDWGRKFAENFLRKEGAQSRDIDRHQRHDVRGQEHDSSIADGCEAAWVRRLKPALDEMSRLLFVSRLHGLHAGVDAQ